MPEKRRRTWKAAKCGEMVGGSKSEYVMTEWTSAFRWEAAASLSDVGIFVVSFIFPPSAESASQSHPITYSPPLLFTLVSLLKAAQSPHTH